MTTTERQTLITHAIGPAGLLSLRTVRGSVRVRGTDGEEARVEARYTSRSPSEGADPEADGVLRVRRSPSELAIDVDEMDLGVLSAIGRLARGGRPAVDFDIDVPRGASLRLSGVSADLDIRGLSGDQEIRTVTGDAQLDDVAGRVSLQSVSGDALVRGGAIALDVTTTSGDLSVVAERLDLVHVRSVSGDVRLSGELAAGPAHSVESVSGDLELAPSNGVTVRMSGISGSLGSELPHRRATERGWRTVVVGDGAAELSFRTMSGDASVVASDGPVTTPEDGLSILQALERGEIDVDEAARRLEGGTHGA